MYKVGAHHVIIGIGIDLVEIARVQKAYDRTSTPFVKRVMTDNEMKQLRELETEKRKIEWLSGRIAAKEAFAKAIGKGFGFGMKFHDIEIIPNELGRPILTLSERLKVDYESKVNFHLTITHTEHYANALVVAEQKPEIS